MDLIKPNIIYDLKGYRRNSKLNLVSLSEKYSYAKVCRNLKLYYLKGYGMNSAYYKINTKHKKNFKYIKMYKD